MSQREKGKTFDGISRPSDDNYRKNFDRIFGKKEKTTSELLMEGFKEEQKMLEEEDGITQEADRTTD
jgi:hypothetical protein